jgi:hypothetical protein
MPYKYKSMDNRRKAKRMLERVMKELENVSPSEAITMEAISSIGKASIYFLRMDNVSELHIYSEGPERWYADVVLKDVPDGYSKVMGSPAKEPLMTQDAAIDYAKAFLLMIRDTPNTAKRPDTVVFTFDDVNFRFPEEVYKQLSDLRKQVDEECTEEYLEDLMERARARVGGELTEARMKAASVEDTAFIWMAATTASLEGHLRWPPNIYDEKEDQGSYGIAYPSNLPPAALKKIFPWRSYE